VSRNDEVMDWKIIQPLFSFCKSNSSGAGIKLDEPLHFCKQLLTVTF
jgi:hypothetical protein